MPVDFTVNPFPNDPDRAALWEILIARDIEAFIRADWSLVADDFHADGFLGVDGRFLPNPDSWCLSFPDLASYRDEWLRQAADFAATAYAEDTRLALYRALSLRDIEINGNAAICHKKFHGHIARTSGPPDTLNWQTLYYARKIDGRWKLTGFTGYLPYPLGAAPAPGAPTKALPAGTTQHRKAGPYSPVLQVNPGQLVVISGQGPLDTDGNLIGTTIEEHARATLANCAKALAQGGCTLADVFKVNVYLTDLADWPAFNVVYAEIMPQPRPVRTAVETGLLLGMKVEIEMWAVRKA